MKLTIERAALLKALGHVQSVVERRNTIPILSNILLSADRDTLSFSATDLDMEIIDEGLAQIDVPGQITAPAHTLYEIVRKLPDGADVSLSFSGDDPRLVIQAGRSRFNLPVLPAGDFPVMSSDGLSGRIAVDTNELIRLIDKTRFAISTEETRYYLNGLYLHTVNDGGETKLRAVATDGHRLALAEMPAPEGAVGLPGVIVPRKTIAEARRLMESAGETVDLQVSPQKVRFEFGAAALTSKVIDGAFPDYLRVIPKGNDKQADIDNTLQNDPNVTKVVKDVEYSLKYYDCTAVLTYNPKTNHMVDLYQYMHVLITGSGKVLGSKFSGSAVLDNFLEITNVKY